MSRQVTVTLTDEEYAALIQEATANGQPVEDLIRRVIKQQLRTRGDAAGLRAAIDRVLYERGVIAAMPTREGVAAADAGERERLAALFAQGQAVSDYVIEERGPR